MAARQARGRKGLTMTLPVRGMSVRLMREDGGMRAALKSIGFQPEPSTLSADPAEFSFLARLIIGPSDSPGEESFDVTGWPLPPVGPAASTTRGTTLWSTSTISISPPSKLGWRPEFTKRRRPPGRSLASGSDA